MSSSVGVLMKPSFRSLDNADVKGKRVLLRVDLNVPMQDGKITELNPYRGNRADHHRAFR